jgi:hypothetical protein
MKLGRNFQTGLTRCWRRLQCCEGQIIGETVWHRTRDRGGSSPFAGGPVLRMLRSPARMRERQETHPKVSLCAINFRDACLATSDLPPWPGPGGRSPGRRWRSTAAGWMDRKSASSGAWDENTAFHSASVVVSLTKTAAFLSVGTTRVVFRGVY